jgi:hypothetical protein
MASTCSTSCVGSEDSKTIDDPVNLLQEPYIKGWTERRCRSVTGFTGRDPVALLLRLLEHVPHTMCLPEKLAELIVYLLTCPPELLAGRQTWQMFQNWIDEILPA